MKFKGTCGTLLLLLSFLVASSAKAASDACQILFAVVPNTCHEVYGQCVELAILNIQEQTMYRIEGTQKMDTFMVSPDDTMVAVELSDALSTQVEIYNITKTPVALIATLPNFSLVGWSRDSTRLLIFNPESDRFLHFIYELSTHALAPLDENLRIYQAAWSWDDQQIAFTANELPIAPGAQALYIKNLKTGVVKPMSDNDADVERFAWLKTGEIAFTSCIQDTCQLRVVTPEGKQNLTLRGNYSLILSSPWNNNLLLGEYGGSSSALAKLLILDTKAPQPRPIDAISNDDLAHVNWSPNGATIAYSNTARGENHLYLADVQTLESRRADVQLDDFGYTGDWHPDNIQLLLSGGQTKKNTFYIYNTKTDTTEMLTLGTINGATFSPKWICPAQAVR